MGTSQEPQRTEDGKAAAPRDELVEMRFYIPGTLSKKEVEWRGCW